MSSTCHVCSTLSSELGTECHCQICCQLFCQDCEKKAISSVSERRDSVLVCDLCLQKYQLKPSKEDSWSAYATPLTSPPSSLTSYESCVSSLGDFLSDLTLPSSREDFVEGTPDTGQEHYNPEYSVNLEDRVPENIGIQTNHVESELDSSDFPKPVEDPEKSGSETAENVEIEGVEQSWTLNIETDSHIWIPPEPEGEEDDTVSSAADNDEEFDNKLSDCFNWCQPTSLGSSSQESSSSYTFREERQKAMSEVMNGRFRAIVRQLLAWGGVSLFEESGECWLNIVTSLSWEAATLVKPDATNGIPMDPGSYVKVKCIASGSRSQSQVIKGLVFKKNAAHKHMLTKYMNPTLLLLRGVIGQHADELLSFDSLEQEKMDYLKSIIDMIEQCQPNVVLVEKTVSRDVQESLFAKGITLVFDMKLHRLEKIARCTGSQIVPTVSDLIDLKLKRCGLFHIEKVVEEHSNYGEGGKCPIKTLMFFEGCPRPMGCTILLRGAHSDELKKVKRVVQYAVLQAYHLIQETSLLVDQRAIFSSTRLGNGCLSHKQVPFVGSSHAIYSNGSSFYNSTAGVASSHTVDIPICDEFLEEPVSDMSTFTHFGFKEKKQDYQSLRRLPGTSLTEMLDHEVELKGRTNLDKNSNCGIDGEKAKNCNIVIDTEFQMQHEDGVEILDPEWILVLLTSRCLLKGTICEQYHLSRVRFYSDSDTSLGRFLHEILLNQKHQCSKCGQSPEAHLYSYTYQNGKLTILVKRLPPEMHLPGEEKGKLWMWTLCLKCNRVNEIPKHTRRVVMSSAAHGLSFGKFLELCIMDNSALSRLSTCGHLLHRDCLQFYGLGSTVAMFNYSSIDIYTACRPAPVLEFYNPNGLEWLHIEAKYVLDKGNLLFVEVMNVLQKIRCEVTSLDPKHPVKDFSEIEEMLKKEKSDFEASLQKVVDWNGKLGQIEHPIFNLNRLNHDLLLELYVWDRRLQSLQLSTVCKNATHTHENLLELPKDNISDGRTERKNTLEDGDRPTEVSPHIAPPVTSGDTSLTFTDSNHSTDVQNMETAPEIKVEEASISDDNLVRDVPISSPSEDIYLKSRPVASEICNSFDGESAEGPLIESQPSAANHEEYKSISDDFWAGHNIPISTNSVVHTETGTNLNPKIEETTNSSALGDISAKSPLQKLYPSIHAPLKRLPSNLEDYESWVWTPLSEIRKVYRKDVQCGYLQKFDFVNSYIPLYLSSANQLISKERSMLHFSLDNDDNVVSVYEDELSSIVACAIALLQDRYHSAENTTEKHRRNDNGGETSKSTDNTYSLFPAVDMASPQGSSSGPLDLEGINTQELTELGSEGFFSVDSLLFERALHPEVPLGVRKLKGRGKYSVICIYAKQFYNLRRRCCPSELDYISSLCRSKKWDAQGGKSRSLFAKTLDDRFVVKQIKKTELHSFLQFGPEYFKHISQSLDSGSQTCLAKILGIYQVIIRQSKSGKDVNVNLMVMENLFFARNISRMYDLKGVLHSRYTNDANGTLLDQNFVEDVLSSPYSIDRKTKQRLQRAIWNDTSFLTSINVMDYSLLLGVDKERRELAYGIVDYLRQYTWDKHLETWAKASLVVPKNELPTVVSPKEYKKRFRKFMSTYFFTVPDYWCSYKILAPVKYCGNSGNDSSRLDNSEFAEKSNK